MIFSACAKRTTFGSLSSLRCYSFGTANSVAVSNALASRMRSIPSARPSLAYCARVEVRSGSCIRQRHRHLSGSSPSSATVASKRPRRGTSSKRRSRQQQQQQQPHDGGTPQAPRWSVAASAMIVPFMFAAWAASDWILGNRTKGHNEGLRQEFLEEQRRRCRHERDDDVDVDGADDWLESLEAKPTLLHCVIRKSKGLTHCLSGVQLGDVVEVLEEGVGPEKAYNLCRLPSKSAQQDQQQGQQQGQKQGQPPLSLSRDTYGWFPIRWLQKMDHYESTVLEQRINFINKDRQ